MPKPTLLPTSTVMMLADKLSILLPGGARPVAVLPRSSSRKHSLRDARSADAAREALERDEVLKQVGRFSLLADGSIEAEVQVRCLSRSHPLALPRNEENRFLVTDSKGNMREVFGKGARTVANGNLGVRGHHGRTAGASRVPGSRRTRRQASGLKSMMRQSATASAPASIGNVCVRDSTSWDKPSMQRAMSLRLFVTKSPAFA